MHGLDTEEEIKLCLECKKQKCDNCLKFAHIGRRQRVVYSVVSRANNKKLVEGTMDECAAHIGIKTSTFKRGVSQGGTKTYIFGRKYL